jgi:hypothetical protein
MREASQHDLWGLSTRELGLDLPVIVGEFPARNSPTATIEEYLDAWHDGGYAGAWAWSFRAVDEHGTPDPLVVERWAREHAQTVAPP